MREYADGYKYLKKKRFLLKYIQDILEFTGNLMCFSTSSTQLLQCIWVNNNCMILPLEAGEGLLLINELIWLSLLSRHL